MGKTICAIFKIKKATTKPRTVRIAANNNAAANVVQRMSVIENFIFADSIKSIFITAGVQFQIAHIKSLHIR